MTTILMIPHLAWLVTVFAMASFIYVKNVITTTFLTSDVVQFQKSLKMNITNTPSSMLYALKKIAMLVV
jgi:hypothetical protein